LSQNQIRPLKRAEYEQLAEGGAFDDEKVELLYGRILTISPQGDPHIWAIRRLTMILAPAVVGRADVAVRSTFLASDVSLPEPDLAIVRSDVRGRPSRASLIIEVAVTSLAYDREVKARLYAETGIPEYWIIDCRHERAGVFREPQAPPRPRSRSRRRPRPLRSRLRGAVPPAPSRRGGRGVARLRAAISPWDRGRRRPVGPLRGVPDLDQRDLARAAATRYVEEFPKGDKLERALVIANR
jgi:Uma2 family endonuclease